MKKLVVFSECGNDAIITTLDERQIALLKWLVDNNFLYDEVSYSVQDGDIIDIGAEEENDG